MRAQAREARVYAQAHERALHKEITLFYYFLDNLYIMNVYF
jgi:hypothetical protein